MMDKRVRAITVSVLPSGLCAVERTEIEDELDVLQGIVGGNIEAVYLSRVHGDGTHMYINEEGKFIDACLPNSIATRLAREHGWIGNDIIMGDVVILGDGEDGEEGNVADWVFDAIARL